MLNKKEQRLRRARQTRIRIAQQGVARLSVNRTNLHIYASVISGCGTKVLASASTAEAEVRTQLGAAGKGGNVAAATLIGKRIAESLPPTSWQIVPGISSVQYLFSRIGLDMNDLYVTSSHGKQPDFDFLFSMPKVAMVTDQLIGPRQIADALQARGLSRTLYIGENLSYPDERIHCLRPADVAPQYAMNVVVILDEGQ